MAASAFPAVVDALVAQAPGVLPAGAVVYDGLTTSSDPSDFLMVGVPSLSESGSAFAGSSQQEWASTGTGAARAEVGIVNCIAVARSVDETPKSARDRAFAIAESIATLCRSGNKDLGVAALLWASYGGETNAYLVPQKQQPPLYVVEFQVGYRARI